MAKQKKQKHPIELSEENSISQSRAAIRRMNLSKKTLEAKAIYEQKLAEKYREENLEKAFYHDRLAMAYFLEADKAVNAAVIAYAGQRHAKNDGLFFAYANLAFHAFSECGDFHLAERLADNARREAKRVASKLERLAKVYDNIAKKFESKRDIAREYAKKQQEEEKADENY